MTQRKQAWFRKWRRSSPRIEGVIEANRRSHLRRRPEVETLEDRTLLAVAVYNSNDTPQPIPDQSTIVSKITVPDVGVVTDVNVQLAIDHTYDSDLEVTLTSPDGIQISLFSGVGSSKNNFTGTILDDEAATPIANGKAPFTGAFKPQEFLSAFDGTTAQGVWTLSVSDTESEDTGTLQSWSLILDSASVETTGDIRGTVWNDLNGDGSRNADEPGLANAVLFLDQNQNGQRDEGEAVRMSDADGNYSFKGLTAGNYTVAEDPPPFFIQTFPSSTGTYTIALGASQVVDGVDFGNHLTSAIYTSTDTPTLIPDESTIVSSILVPDAGLVRNISVQLNINHTYDSDLEVTLTGPDGTQVPLFSGVGDAGNNFTGTILGDGADTPISAGTAPFTGSFEPEGTLSAFNGKTAQGVWALSISDTVSGDSGTLQNWSLILDSTPADTAGEIHGTVWSDENGDGISDADEPGLSNLLLFLDQNQNGQRDLGEIATLTNANGKYAFTGLAPGNYTVAEKLPAGFIQTFPGVTDAHTITLGDGQVIDHVDFGNHAVPDLACVTFNATQSTVSWGDALAFNYVLENMGKANPGPFDVEVRLSSDGVIDASDLLLTTFRMSDGLAEEDQTLGSLSLLLPGSPGNPPGSFAQGQDIFLGLIIDPANAVQELNESNNSNQGAGIDLNPVATLGVFSELEPDDDLARALPVSRNSRVSGQIASAGDQDWYQITLTESVRLMARVHAVDCDTRLALFDAEGNLLVQSDGESLLNPDDLVIQYLTPSTFYLHVEAIGSNETGWYELTTTATPAAAPRLFAMPVGDLPRSIVSADFNGDGHVDLATANEDSDDVSVLLGLGDGTFGPTRSFTVGTAPSAIVAGDFNGDGHADLVTSNDDDVSVLLGLGDGAFAPARTFTLGIVPGPLAVGDFDRDGNTDLAVSNYRHASNNVLILRGLDDGSFAPAISLALPVDPGFMTVGDFDEDGNLDLAAENADANEVSVLLGLGNGSFSPGQSFAVGDDPYGLVAGDFNGDDHLDLACANGNSNDVSVLLGLGDGTFGPALSFAVGLFPTELAAEDFNGDGHVDLVTANLDTNDVSILLGSGDGTFESARSFHVGFIPDDLCLGDFNEDGVTDVATANTFAYDVSILLGFGDGTFADISSAAAGAAADAGVAGDFNGDGRLDFAISSSDSNAILVLTGLGDGTFAPAQSIPVEFPYLGLVAADFNQDGRLDLATNSSNSDESDSVAVLLGLGNGSFAAVQYYVVGAGAYALAAVDVNVDGWLDLVSASADSNAVWVLLGAGDGTFAPAQSVPAGGSPYSMAIGDVNADHRPDIITADLDAGTVSVLLGLSGGGFAPAQLFEVPLGETNTELAAGDIDGDDDLDVIASNSDSNELFVLVNQGDGGFALSQPIPVGDYPETAEVADVNADGHLDLITPNFGSDDVSVLLGLGDGTFAPARSFPVAIRPHRVAAGDVNGDDHIDLCIANDGSEYFSVLLGNGEGDFTPASTISYVVRSTPLRGDLDGDGIEDLTIVAPLGTILFRKGRMDGSFVLPVVVNRDQPARDATLVETDRGLEVAAIDREGGALSVYGYQANGSFVLTDILATGLALPVRVQAADLNGDGRGDLAVTDADTGNVALFLGQDGGGFSAPLDLAGVVGATDLKLADVDNNGTVDIVIPNQIAGDLTVLPNPGNADFADVLRYRAGQGPFGYDADTQSVFSNFAGAEDVALGDFNGDGATDLVALNPAGLHSLGMLFGRSGSSFTDPQTLEVQDEASQVDSGDFNDDGKLDLALLYPKGFQILTGDGAGGFTAQSAIDVGNNLFGLTVQDANGDGDLDLQVGTEFGDVLTLAGNGDGTFQPYHRAGGSIPIATGSATGPDGNPIEYVVVANEALDQVVLQVRQPGTDKFTVAFSDDRTTNPLLRGPRAVELDDLDGDGNMDVLVSSSGGDNVLVYFGHGFSQEGGQTVAKFDAPISIFAGTNPVGLAVNDLNNDSVPDLAIANRGSNDVSILFGQIVNGQWTATPGPLLSPRDSNGKPLFNGPIDLDFREQTGDGILDLVVVNSQGGNLTVLTGVGVAGVGNGTFDSTNPLVLDFPGTPVMVESNIQAGAQSGFLVTQDGDIEAFDLNTRTSSSAFSPTESAARVVALQTGDFDSDGQPDVLAARSDGTVSVLLGQVDGTLQQAGSLTNPNLTNASRIAVSAEYGSFYVTNEGDNQPIPFQANFDDFFGDPNPPPGLITPPPTMVAAVGETVLTGSLNFAGDPDFIPFVAPGMGLLLLQFSSGDSLQSSFTVVDAGGDVVASDDDGDGLLELDLTSGTTYYLEIEDPEGDIGDYQVGFGFTPSPSNLPMLQVQSTTQGEATAEDIGGVGAELASLENSPLSFVVALLPGLRQGNTALNFGAATDTDSLLITSGNSSSSPFSAELLNLLENGDSGSTRVDLQRWLAEVGRAFSGWLPAMADNWNEVRHGVEQVADGVLGAASSVLNRTAETLGISELKLPELTGVAEELLETGWSLAREGTGALGRAFQSQMSALQALGEHLGAQIKDRPPIAEKAPAPAPPPAPAALEEEEVFLDEDMPESLPLRVSFDERAAAEPSSDLPSLAAVEQPAPILSESLLAAFFASGAWHAQWQAWRAVQPDELHSRVRAGVAFSAPLAYRHKSEKTIDSRGSPT